MSAASVLRAQIESSLQSRFPRALSVPFLPPAELIPTAIAEVDSLLGGGLPLGSLAEIVGPPCSGRSSIALSIVSHATRQGAACAYVDVDDMFDPASAAALGTQFDRFLWVRPGAGRSYEAVGTAKVRATPRRTSMHLSRAGGNHPRMESRGMATAVHDLFNGAPEVVDFATRVPQLAQRPHTTIDPPKTSGRAPARSSAQDLSAQPWERLQQALRATDLLLNTGGFRILVLDMGDIAPEAAARIPLASWYRYRLQAEKSQTLFLSVAQTACAHSCASAVLRCGPADALWSHALACSPHVSVLDGFRYQTAIDRKRASARAADLQNPDPRFAKPPASVSHAVWERPAWAI